MVISGETVDIFVDVSMIFLCVAVCLGGICSFSFFMGIDFVYDAILWGFQWAMCFYVVFTVSFSVAAFTKDPLARCFLRPRNWVDDKLNY